MNFKFSTFSFHLRSVARLAPLFVLFLFISVQSAHAQELSIGVYPPVIQIEAEAPADAKSPIVVQNFTNEPVTLNVYFRPFKASDKNNGQVEFLPVNALAGEDKQIFQKIQLMEGAVSRRKITLAPKQKKEFSLRVRIPKNEPPSDYYFSILFISTTDSFGNSNLTQAAAGVASNVILSIGPKSPTTGSISEFSAPLFLSRGPVPFTIKVKNTSSHFITIKGNLVIKNIFGQIVGNINLVPVNVLENSQRLIPDKNSIKNINDQRVVWPEKFLMGLYSAETTISLSEEGPVIHKKIGFRAFPLEAIIAIVIALLIVALAWKRMRYRT